MFGSRRRKVALGGTVPGLAPWISSASGSGNGNGDCESLLNPNRPEPASVNKILRGSKRMRKIHATRKADPNATGAPIDPDAAEVQQLKSAAMPSLFQLREDQKEEVRSLARLIGLEKVAAQI